MFVDKRMSPQFPFVLYADCRVIYDGRASSVLERGHYLIIYKGDYSLSIHGSDKIVPRNYQGPGAKLTISGNKITSKRKSEVIEIEIFNILWEQQTLGWSNDQIKITRTEKDLVNKIITNPEKYFGVAGLKVMPEYQTDVGPIDIVAMNESDIFVVEVKRKRITLNNCTQLRKYIDAWPESETRVVHPCMAGPSINPKAEKYCSDRGFHYIHVDFD